MVIMMKVVVVTDINHDDCKDYGSYVLTERWQSCSACGRREEGGDRALRVPIHSSIHIS